MTTSSTTPLTHVAVAESVLNELATGRDTYWYYYGKNLPFDGSGVEDVFDNTNYENYTRKNITIVKKITTNNVVPCTLKHVWTNNTVYDMYDDSYHGGKVTSIDVTNGGSNYSNATTIVIESPNYGVPATASPIIVNGSITHILIDESGSNYSVPPIVTAVDTTGSGAFFSSNLSSTNLAYSGASTLKDAQFYVITSENKVYKCLDNNNNSLSTVEPSSIESAPFTTADGYMWKFMYIIPQSMLNKWSTQTYLPVTKQTTNSYYSNGGIDNVVITNPGSGYTYGNLTRAYIVGDGVGAVLQPNVNANTSITSCSIINGGSGYSTTTTKYIKTLTRSTNVTTCVTYIDHKMVVGTQFTLSGSSGFNGTFTVTQIDDKNTFKFANTGTNTTVDYGTIDFTNASVNISNITRSNNVVTVVTNSVHGLSAGQVVTIAGVVTQTDLNGKFKIESIVNTTTFTYSLIGLDVSATTGTVTFNSIGIYSIQLSGGNLVTVTCVSNHGRTTGNTVTINSGNSNFGQAYSTTITVLNSTAFTYTKSGTNSITTSPSIVYTTGVNVIGGGTGKYAGNTTAKMSCGIYSGAIDTVAITDPGLSYTSGQSAYITVSGDGSGAIITPVISSSGQLTSAIIDNPGSGYTYAAIVVSAPNGEGSGAKMVATTNKGNIDTLQFVTEIQSIDGAIYTTKMTNNGTGYSYANVTIVGDGQDATAYATIVNTQISKITILNNGTGYTYANIVITGDGSNASCRAIISPKGGHGSDAVKELFASNLMFFSNLTDNDTINGKMIDNGYYQYGVMKNLKQYDSKLRYNSGIGTSCFTIYGTFTGTNFPNDAILKIVSNSVEYTFSVIASQDNMLIISQNDSYSPQVGDDIIKISDVSKHFIISSITNPDIDKYSGELLYINNSTEFYQAPSQAIKSRTVIAF